MSTTAISRFQFLIEDSPKLFELATDAEVRFRAGDAIGCVSALRTFGEEATRILLDGRGIAADTLDYATQARRIEELYDRGSITNFAYNGLHALRSIGNEAVHEWNVSQHDARDCLGKAYQIALAERGVLAPRARLNLKTAVEYEAPPFGETRLAIDGLLLENEQLREQLGEVQQLLQARTEEQTAVTDDLEQRVGVDLGMTVRLRWVIELSEAHRELEHLRQRSRRERPRMLRSTAQMSENFKRVRQTIARLERELAASFFVERQLANLLARRHKATEVRRQLELHGRDWPEYWDQRFRAIEDEIQVLSADSVSVENRVHGVTGFDAIHIEIVDCFRRLALAEALLGEFKARQLCWPVAWARAHRELKARRDQLVASVL